jgi:two-component system, OmpR family, phosphate regulon sensor histidine kinase PhoR
MNRKNIVLLVIVMTGALVGLLSMQLFWIRNASDLKEITFRRSVNEAMAKVVYKLEGMEQRKASEANQYGGMLNFNKHLDYSEFVTSGRLDSLISLELNMKGIDTRFEFGIYKPEKDLFLMEKSGNVRQQLIRKGYAFQLFATDTFTSPEYLLVWFPNEKQFLLTELWGMLLISIILIVVIVYSFSYTVSTLIRQKKLSEMKSDFMNNMTHEFKTPITTISLACETMKDPSFEKSDAFYETYIHMIKEETNRLSLLAEKILQSAVIEKGQLKMKHEQVDLHAVIREVVKNQRVQVELKDGEIHTGLRAKEHVIEGDKVHLTNLVYNLLDNANKYSPKKLVIRVNTDNTQKGVIMTISDNGIGISKAEQKRVFEKLYRVPTGDIHGVRGFGLGLSYVKTIVDEHKGTIHIESEVNAGSKFEVYLPFRIPEH